MHTACSTIEKKQLLWKHALVVTTQGQSRPKGTLKASALGFFFFFHGYCQGSNVK